MAPKTVAAGSMTEHLRRGWAAWTIACTCLLTSGCHLVYHERSGVLADGLRTVVREPRLFNLHKNDYVTRLRNRMLAGQAWSDMLASNPGQSFSADYCHGFKDGFADFLYAGGSGEPPALPPRRYWKIGYETPAGRQAIEDYFSGFRHGAEACRASGYREMTTVPSSLRVDPGTAELETIEGQPISGISVETDNAHPSDPPSAKPLRGSTAPKLEFMPTPQEGEQTSVEGGTLPPPSISEPRTGKGDSTSPQTTAPRHHKNPAVGGRAASGLLSTKPPVITTPERVGERPRTSLRGLKDVAPIFDPGAGWRWK